MLNGHAVGKRQSLVRAVIVCFLQWHLTDVKSWNARMSEEHEKRNGTCMLKGFRGNLAKIVVHGHRRKSSTCNSTLHVKHTNN